MAVEQEGKKGWGLIPFTHGIRKTAVLRERVTTTPRRLGEPVKSISRESAM